MTRPLRSPAQKDMSGHFFAFWSLAFAADLFQLTTPTTSFFPTIYHHISLLDNYVAFCTTPRFLIQPTRKRGHRLSEMPSKGPLYVQLPIKS